jgi:hypothetical protein
MILKLISGKVFNVFIKITAYKNNDRTALTAVSLEDGSPVATFTKNMNEWPCPSNHAWIKDYAENEGFMTQLINGGVIAAPIEERISGYVKVFLCPVLI